MNVANDDITLSLLVHVEAEDGRYRSSCPAIEVTSAGRTIDEALSNIDEAVGDKLEIWVEDGSIYAQLAAYGIPYVRGRSKGAPAHAYIPPGVIAATLNQHVKVS